MPFVIATIAIIFLVSAVRGTQSELLAQFREDMLGDRNFIYFIAAILFVGSWGYIPQMRKLSAAFLVLIFVVLILSNGNVFNKIVEQLDAASSGK